MIFHENEEEDNSSSGRRGRLFLVGIQYLKSLETDGGTSTSTYLTYIIIEAHEVIEALALYDT